MKRSNFLKIAFATPFALGGIRAAIGNTGSDRYEELTKENKSQLKYGDAVAYLRDNRLRFGRVDNRYIHESRLSVADARHLGQHAGNPCYRSVIGLTLDGKILAGRDFQKRRDLPEIIKNLKSMIYRR